ncbi:MAG: BBP7 family outer membrane beta-barrel protein [Gemmataceae bacterium]
MRTRWLAAWAALLCGGPAVAQPPAELPLIPVPIPEAPPASFAPGGTVPPYDHGHLYLPEPGPEFERRQPMLDELWRVSAAAQLGWLSTRGLPGTLSLTPPDVFGRTVAGLNIPTDGRGNDSFQGGLSLDVGRRLGERSGVDASLFLLPEGVRRLQGYAPGALVYSPDWTRDAPVLVALPAGLGTTFPATLSTTFVGADVNYRYTLLRAETARVDVLAGYRFAYLTDELYLGDRPDGGGRAYQNNRLQAETTFHGGQVGVAVGLDYGAWYTDGVAKIAYGTVTTDTSASGAFGFANPRPRLGGGSSGAVLPTVAWKVGVRFGGSGSVFASYSFQYLDRVARLGDAFCGCGGPSDLWVNSLGLGMELRF